MIAGSLDGIFEDGIVEIKCPIKKYYAQMQLQMYLSQKKNCCFCIADPDFSQNKKVDIINIEFDPQYVENFINKLLNFWKINIYPLLYQSVE
ncbi:hypothetical protein SFRURICE_015044 [Spodoptera frugiperda]|nr:hypothetical protein SFRURICE_015044 [Spodoptera frugiperda]